MAGGGKISPRQKMINMMYLVLTAMLALNVSAEILKAFYLVEKSMDKAGVNIDAKNQDLMRAFKTQLKNQPEKTKPFYDQAKKAQKITNDFVNYVEDLKKTIITHSGSITMEEARQPDGQLVSKSDIEIHAYLMISPEGPQKGKELRDKVNKTRDDLLGLLKPFKALKKDAARIKEQTDLKTEDPKEGAGGQTWQSELFEHSPQAAVVTLLTKIQNDAKNTNAEVLTSLFTGITAEEMSFDQLMAKFIPEKAAVGAGEEFKAQVILTAYNSKSNDKVIINGQEYQMENGIVQYSTKTSSPGEYDIKGEILVQTKDGEKPYPFTSSYSVYKGEASISADKMNVLYIGLDNPITVAVPGANPRDVSARLSTGGSLVSKGGGRYLAKVSKRGDTKVLVTVKSSKEGEKAKSYQQPFRIRPIPKPEAQLGTLQSGTHSRGVLRAQSVVLGSLGQGFAYEDVRYSVLSYQFVYAPRKGDADFVNGQGAALPGKARAILSRLKPGDRIIVDQIKARGPDGVRDLAPLVITAR